MNSPLMILHLVSMRCCSAQRLNSNLVAATIGSPRSATSLSRNIFNDPPVGFVLTWMTPWYRRVTTALGDDVSIWEVRSPEFGTSVLRTQSSLSEFRKVVGRVFDEIRMEHGADACLSVFPAVPAACAIEFGRAWQPKAHPEFDIYDETPNIGFILRNRIITDL